MAELSNEAGTPCALCGRTEWHRQGSIECEQTELALRREQVASLTQALDFAANKNEQLFAGLALPPLRYDYTMRDAEWR